MTDPTTQLAPVVFERIIDATPDEAFALFTEPERLRRWKAVSAAVDLRIGGDYRLTVTPGNIASGTFTEIEPGRRVVYTWGWVGSEDLPPGASTVVVDIEPTGDKTLVRLTHHGLSPDQAVSHGEGWTHYLERLGDVTGSGDAGLDPWASGPDELDHLAAAEASWALCRNVMQRLTPEDRERRTPCRDYTVHDLVEHLMGSVRALGAIAGAEVPDEIDASTAEDYIAQATEPALAAWRERGLDGEVPFGSGTAPATVPVGILGIEFFIHGWDLAQAIDESFAAPERLTAFVTARAEEIIRPDNRGEGKGFAAVATPAHDDAITALMAFTGRAT
ncbi:MAG: TIGR03086 family metal-binding protein [Ilumatobacteraceae bacterium]